MFFFLPGKIKTQSYKGGSMKKVVGILVISCICIMLGLSVKWSKEKNLSLVDPMNELGLMVEMR